MSYFKDDDSDNDANIDSREEDAREEDVEEEVVGGNEAEENDEIDDDEEEEEGLADDSDDDEENYDNIQHGGDDSDDSSSPTTSPLKRKVPITIGSTRMHSEDSDLDTDDEEDYLQRFDQELNQNYLEKSHPECILQNYDEILILTTIVRNATGIIIDPLHKSIPFLTKYEKARILGQRAKQLNSGATPFVKIPENIIDGYLIAELELREKRIPFIIRRPLPNGGSEFWHVKDLENISF